MKSTQINEEIYVAGNDVVDWLRENLNDLSNLDPVPDAEQTIKTLAAGLKEWVNHPDRKKGVPNLEMRVIK